MAYSKAKLKNSGDKASPCFRPFSMLNLSDRFLPIRYPNYKMVKKKNFWFDCAVKFHLKGKLQNMITLMLLSECIVSSITFTESAEEFLLLFFRFDKFVGDERGFYSTGCSTTPASSYPMPTHVLRCKCHAVEGLCSGL
jgi:hypothetical protein